MSGFDGWILGLSSKNDNGPFYYELMPWMNGRWPTRRRAPQPWKVDGRRDRSGTALNPADGAVQHVCVSRRNCRSCGRTGRFRLGADRHRRPLIQPRGAPSSESRTILCGYPVVTKPASSVDRPACPRRAPLGGRSGVLAHRSMEDGLVHHSAAPAPPWHLLVSIARRGGRLLLDGREGRRRGRNL
jgi:hypothetical protein